MAYTVAWDESLPDGSENAATIDTEIQNFKIAVRERLEDFFPGWDDDGEDPKLPIWGYPRCELSRSSALTITTGTQTNITAWTEDLDQGAMYNVGGAGAYIVVPASLGGLYLVTWWVEWAATTTAATLECVLDDDTDELSGNSVSVDAKNVTRHLSGAWVGELAAADQVRLRVQQDTGGNLDVANARFSAVRLFT